MNGEQISGALEFLEEDLVVCADEVSEKMALCAMAETLYSHSGRKAGVTCGK